MPLRSLEARFFVDEPPEIIYENGLFHVSQIIGDYRFERVMRPSVFIAGLRRAAEAARMHKFGGAEIIHAEFDSKFERVFPKDKETA